VTRRPYLLLVCLAGCAPEIDYVEWNPLEPDEVEEALGAPTALLGDVLTPERLDAIAQRMPLLLEHTRFAAEVVDGLAEVADEVPAEGGGAAGSAADDALRWEGDQGTVFYFGVGCPGPGPELDFDTKHGVMRIDSERLDSFDPSALLDGGSVLFEFRDCQLGAVRVDGNAPAVLQLAREAIDPTGMFPVVESTFAMATDLSGMQVSGTKSPVGVTGFLCRGYGSCAEYQDVRAELDGGKLGTAVASFSLDRTFWLNPVSIALRLAAASGSASCEYDAMAGALDCSVDDD
jgi:hypothetical protein